MSIIRTFFVITELIGSYHFLFGHFLSSNRGVYPANSISHFSSNINRGDYRKRLVQLYCQQFADMKPQAVERTFRLPILDISTGLFESSRDILGKIDLISDDGVVELKTSARSVNQRAVDTSLQLTLYSWAYRMIFGHEEKSLKTIALLKTAKSSIQTIETCRTTEDHSRLMELISQVIRAVELRVFYRNPAT